MPVDKCILTSVIKNLPNPIVAQKSRIEVISRKLANINGIDEKND